MGEEIKNPVRNALNSDADGSQNLYQCKECGLHYKDKDIAEKCEAWCKQHKTCNVEIISHAQENKRDNDNQGQSSFTKASEHELSELKKKCDEYLNNWKRERADFLNYKKDEIERMAMLVNYTKEDIIYKILSILDNIELAEKQLPEKLKKPSFAETAEGQGGDKFSSEAVEWTKGFLQIQNQIKEFLKKEGIEEIETIGKKFNPEIMEAVGEAEAEGGDEGTIVEETQKGYIMSGKVIRPAKVKISK